MKEGRSSKGRNMCFAVTGGVVVAIVLIVVILALTVFKPQHPISTVDSIKLKDMDMSFDIFGMKVNLNATLNVDVSVKNTNKYGFKYYDGIALLNYRGQQVGDAPIPNGEISSGETKRMNVTLTLMADRLISNSQVTSDVILGSLPFNTFIRVYGKVNILGFIKFHVDSFSSCDFTLNIPNKTVDNNECQYKTKQI